MAFRVANDGGGKCRVLVRVNGVGAASSRFAVACGDGTVRGTSTAYRLRLGEHFRGRLNDVLLRDGSRALADSPREIYAEYNGLASAHLAFWSFNNLAASAAAAPAQTRFGNAFDLAPRQGGAVFLERHAYRGFERCPGGGPRLRLVGVALGRRVWRARRLGALPLC